MNKSKINKKVGLNLAVVTIDKKQKPSVRRQFAFIFLNFFSGSSSGLFNKVPGKALLGGNN